MVKGKILYTLLGFKDLKNLDNTINTVEPKLLKLNFKSTKYLIVDKVFIIMVKLLIVLDTHLYLITNYNMRFEALSIVLNYDFI